MSQSQRERFLNMQMTVFRAFLGDGGASNVREGKLGLVVKKGK